MMKKEDVIANSCYICGELHRDKVRLGVHIARCYDDAKARGEHWHPHPDIILDEIRYSQYMLSGEREKNFKSADKKKVAFSTQDDFANLQSMIGTSSSPKRNELPSLPSPTVGSSPKKFVPTSTYQSDFNKGKGGGAGGSPNSNNSSPTSGRKSYALQNLTTATPVAVQNNQVYTPIDNVPSVTTSAAVSPPSPRSSQQQQQQLPPTKYSSPPASSSPSFGQPGLNTLRNELASELANVKNFMKDEKRRAIERDEALERIVDGATTAVTRVSSKQVQQQQQQQQQLQQAQNHYQTQQQAVYGNPAKDPNRIAFAGGGGGRSSTPRSATPRGGPIDKNQLAFPPPSTGNVRDNMIGGEDVVDAIHGGGFDHEEGVSRVACSRCGRYFGSDKVSAHEEVCVSKPKGIHRR